MIKTITLKAGPIPDAPPETWETTPITVFVGPNNSGKSVLLKEIHECCRSGSPSRSAVVLDNIAFQPLTEEAAREFVKRLAPPSHIAPDIPPGLLAIVKGRTFQTTDAIRFLARLVDPSSSPSEYCDFYLSTKTLMLDGQTRISLADQKQASDMQQIPSSTLQALFTNDELRSEVRRIVFEAFEFHFVIDPTHLGILRVRMSDRAPASASEERGLDDQSITFHGEASLISRLSDGVKAFTGIVMEVTAGDPDVLLVDEPEAFLHPVLSFKLGKELAHIMQRSHKRLFVATHSPDFVMGCVQGGCPVNIVRLTYQGGAATSRMLAHREVSRLFRNPLLRSAGVLSGLFYESVVVTEGDSDRAFYQEVNERLLRFSPERGIPNCLFLHAQGKQRVKDIVRPLRDLGIPAAAIVDIDIVKEGGKAWKGFLASGFVPGLDIDSLAVHRSGVEKGFGDRSERDMKLEGGVEILPDDDREAANNLFDKLAQYGLFVVRRGELEAWLPDVGAKGKPKEEWLVDVFEKMGEDPAKPEYVRPSEDDVWEFIASVSAWLRNPRRRGIPPK